MIALMVKQKSYPLAKYIILFLALAFGFSSCATILNGRKERVDIITPVPARAVVGQDTFHFSDSRIRLRVDRSEQPLVVKLLAGDFANEYHVFSRNSFAYWLNLYANYGLGMIVDFNSPRRYSYPRRVYLNPLDGRSNYTLWQPPLHDQEFTFRIEIPYINLFHLRPDFEPNIRASGGFWGLAIGLDYYHQPQQFLSLNLGAQTNFIVPVPAVVDIQQEYEVMRSESVSFTNNHWLGRFTVGYGLSFSNYTWEFRSPAFGSPIPPTRRPAERATLAIGLEMPVHFYTGDHFYFKFLYRPSFWRFSRIRPVGYEHLVSLGFGWDIFFR